MEYENQISEKEMEQIRSWAKDIKACITMVDPLFVRVASGRGIETFLSKNNLSSGWTWHNTDEWLLMRIAGGAADNLTACMNQAYNAIPSNRMYVTTNKNGGNRKMVNTKKGTWFRLDEPKGFPLRSRNEIISRIRWEGGTVEDSAPIAVYISKDKNEKFYAVEGMDGPIFWDCHCFTPANYEEACAAVEKVLK